MSRVNYYQSAFNSQKEISKSGLLELRKRKLSLKELLSELTKMVRTNTAQYGDNEDHSVENSHLIFPNSVLEVPCKTEEKIDFLLYFSNYGDDEPPRTMTSFLTAPIR